MIGLGVEENISIEFMTLLISLVYKGDMKTHMFVVLIDF